MMMTTDDRGQSKAWELHEELRLTLDLERVSPLASTQTYSAMMEPFWSSLRYLFNYSRSQNLLAQLVWVWARCGLTLTLQRPESLSNHLVDVHEDF